MADCGEFHEASSCTDAFSRDPTELRRRDRIDRSRQQQCRDAGLNGDFGRRPWLGPTSADGMKDQISVRVNDTGRRAVESGAVTTLDGCFGTRAMFGGVAGERQQDRLQILAATKMRRPDNAWQQRPVSPIVEQFMHEKLELQSAKNAAVIRDSECGRQWDYEWGMIELFQCLVIDSAE